jgi:uncharacterized protein YndB with AHSA1/START domain
LRLTVLVFGLMAALWTTVRAEVVESSPAGFQVRTSVEVGVPCERAYRGLVEEVDRWWDPAHTYSGSASNLSMEASAGGCFCERYPGGSVEHARVVYASPGKTLRLVGGLGPLQSEPVNGVLEFSFEPTAAGSRVTMSYRVGGPLPADWAPGVDRVLAEQMERLQRYLNGVGSGQE